MCPIDARATRQPAIAPPRSPRRTARRRVDGDDGARPRANVALRREFARKNSIDAREETSESRKRARAKRSKRGVANAARAMGGESEVFRAWDQATKSQKRTDLKKIMILGAGPIVIGQVRARDDALGEGGEANGAGWEGVIANASAGAFLNIQTAAGAIARERRAG